MNLVVERAYKDYSIQPLAPHHFVGISPTAALPSPLVTLGTIPNRQSQANKRSDNGNESYRQINERNVGLMVESPNPRH